MAAVVRQRWERLDRVMPADGLCWLAVSTLHSPGNLGTLLRTSDAVGGAGLILIGPNIDPYDPAVVRATMGAVFSQRFVRATLPELCRWRDWHRCALIGTSPAAADDYQAVLYPRGAVLFIGGERRGLSEDELAACDRAARIPMVGRSDSLNMAVAGSVLLYEVFNQRRANAEVGVRNGE
jgi:TrmH family RNA methyltransferase